MVDMEVARMTSVAPDSAGVDPFEVARAELVEALARVASSLVVEIWR